MNNKHDPRNPILPSDEDVIIMFTDGSSKSMQTDSPFGGYGAILTHKGVSKEIFGGQDMTTNNRMEMTAVIKGLEAINVNYGCDVNIYSDSALIVNCINDKWYTKWESNGWVNSKKESVINKDLWEDILHQIKRFEGKGLSVNFIKVKSHIGIPLNEIADDLANKGAQLIADERLKDELEDIK